MNYQSRNLIISGENSQVGNLWLGDYESARNKRSLRADGINAVVTAGLGMKISYTNEFTHKLLPLYDCEAEDIARSNSNNTGFSTPAMPSLMMGLKMATSSFTAMQEFLAPSQSWLPS